MTERQDFIALDWVAGEIGETLKQAAEALEAYVANPDDATRLRFCLTHIHQVQGTLQMVEFFGAALLAEEMEGLAHALIQGSIHSSHVDDALGVLKNAIQQLPRYLEKVKESRHGLPAALLPVLNDLRAVRGESLLSETVLFAPDIQSSENKGTSTLSISQSELQDVAPKLRQMFQIALLGLIRGNDLKKNLNYLAKVCGRLVKLSEGYPSQPLWHVCIALLEGLLNRSIASSVAVKILLRQVDRQIKEIIDLGEPALEKSPPADLLKNLLYYVARSKSNSRFISEIKARYKLDVSLLGDGELDEEALAKPDNFAMQSVVLALAQELKAIQIAFQQAGSDSDALTNILPLFKRVSDTMAILGLGGALKQLQQPYSRLAKLLATQESLDEQELTAILAQVAEVEATINPKDIVVDDDEKGLFNDSEEAQEQLDSAYESVIRESRNSLEQAKESIIEFVATQWNHDSLIELPDQLASIRGSLNMVPLAKAAGIIAACEQFVRHNLLAEKSVPDWQVLDTLADAITSVDYYLERLQEGSNEDGNAILSLAADSVAELGYPLAGESTQVDVAESTEPSEFVEALDLIEAPESSEPPGLIESSELSESSESNETAELAEPPTLEFSQETETTSELSASDDDETDPPLLSDEGASLEAMPVVEDEREEPPVLAEAIPLKSTAEPEELSTSDSQPNKETFPDEDPDFDPEIVEIFIEEAGEVLEEINENLPQWQADVNNKEAAGNVRRAFHTLKGSGRMVGAVDIGELGWSIENMLNRVLDGSVAMDAVRFELIAQTKDMVPGLVDAFEHRQNIDNAPMEAIIAQANLLAEQQSPDLRQFTVAVAAVDVHEDDQAEAATEQRTAAATHETAEAEESTVSDVDQFAETLATDVVTDNDLDEEQEAQDEEIDSELLEIFAAEASTHLQVLDEFISHCHDLAGPADLTDDLQRALHTLKGSANMAGMMPVAEVVTPLEYAVKELRASQLKVDPPLLVLLEYGSGLIKAGLEQLGTTPLKPLSGTAEYIKELMALFNERIASAVKQESEESGIPPEALNTFLTESLDLITEISGRLVLWQQGDAEPDDIAQLEQLMDRFISHAETVNMFAPIEFGQALYVVYRQAGEISSTAVPAEFFTLMNEANDCLVDMLDQIAGQQTPSYDEDLLNRVRDFEFVESDPLAFAEAETVTDLPVIDASTLEFEPDDASSTAISQPQDQNSDDFELDEEDLVASLSADDELEAEADEYELDLDATINSPSVDLKIDEPAADVEGVVFEEAEPEEAGPEKAESKEAGLEEQAEPGSSQKIVIGEYEDPTLSDDLSPDQEAEDSAPFSDNAKYFDQDTADITGALSNMVDAVNEAEETHSPSSTSRATAEPVDTPAVSVAEQEADDDDIDDEIVEIFLEEADDLLEGIDEALHGLMDDLGNREYLDDLLRILHTLKGGARLAGLIPVGDLSHNFETSLMALESRWGNIDETALNALQEYQDQLVAQIAAVKAGELLAPVESQPEPAEAIEEATEETTEEATEIIQAADPEPEADGDIEEESVGESLELSFGESFEEHSFEEVSSEESFELDEDDLDGDDLDLDDLVEDSTDSIDTVRDQEKAVTPVPTNDRIAAITSTLREVSAERVNSPAIDSSPKKGSQEVVKVSAQLLGELVNLAGETSISRSRAEEQISELVFSLDDMQITVDRLQEQVRRLDMETEQQILYRQEQVESEGLEGFDPLEMDRYSQLQQLSRSLLESSSDLIDIKSTLADKSRDMETLLIQQSRINTELQEGLMRSQMVPFSRMVPRLRRIVRQVSGELDKRVDFHLENIEGELDRTVLERMVAPLEHMLRNAVDHGIEPGDVREAAGKSRRGSITLDLAREGGEIVITLTDDGGGINLAAVKSKAIERGLMEPEADLTDHEILQFILQSGFSTASEITQISGRGVGMDVVHSEIKQLGGTVEIDSTPGKGTQFTVRLPFTVSVNRALMVSVGGDRYAIPLNSIEGIVRVSPFELEAYYQPDAPMFEYAGQPYLLRYMGALLHRGEKPILEGQLMPLPVVLVRGAEHSVAIQVDGLMGSREIVVKPLGPQFSMVQGLSGATVLGDGSVVVILDLLAMIRADASHLHRDMIYDQSGALVHRNTLVMVIDDSVTVRKVTSRLLERQGMDVITAKDGVDAVTQLQEMEQLPDVMLLDIEMPRMDGFEVASRVRHTSRLQDIPIIMITSRTGEKHRERALSLGVNEYMGKPYQEVELLETINTLTSVTSPR